MNALDLKLASCTVDAPEYDSYTWRFAELAARTGLEPELAERFAVDPRSVLAEFGIPASEMDGSPALALTTAPAVLVIEELDQPDPDALAALSFTWSPDPNTPAVAAVSA